MFTKKMLTKLVSRISIRNFSVTCVERNQLKYLTPSQFQQYKNDGYTVVRNLLNTQEVEEARDALWQLIEKSRNVNESDNIYELMGDHTKENPRLNRVRFPSYHHPVFRKILNHPKLLDCVEDLIGDSFRYIPQDKLNVKAAGNGAAVPWHQDWAFFPHTNDSVLTVSVLLYDVTKENGCLQVIPGSHKGPTYSHQYNGQFVSAITDENADYSNPHYLEAPAGSLTIHNARAVHGSAKNHSKNPRSTVCYIFTAMDAWPLLGVGGPDFKNIGPVDCKKFDETRIRGKPCETPRMENIPVRLPVPLCEDASVFNVNFNFTEPT